jgi:hypothetical protein
VIITSPPDCANFRLLSYWISFSKITEAAKIWGLLFPTVKKFLQILTKTGLGYILRDFFTNSSGHPVKVALCILLVFQPSPSLSCTCPVNGPSGWNQWLTTGAASWTGLGLQYTFLKTTYTFGSHGRLGGQYYDHGFQRFSPIFWEKLVIKMFIFLYQQALRSTYVLWVKQNEFLQIFSAKIF